MSVSPDYVTDKKHIHAELVKLAKAGELTYYGVLGATVGKPARRPLWKRVLDEFAREELGQGKPDITFLVLSAKTGWPSQISFTSTHGKPTPKLMRDAQSGLDKVFRLHCPGKPTPMLPQRKRA